MTPAARLQTAIELLEAVETGRRPADQVLASGLRARRFMGSKDRRAVTALVYDLLRRRARLDWWLGEAGAEEGLAPAERPRRRALAWLALQGENPATLCDGSHYGPAPLDAAEQDLVAGLAGRSLEDPRQPAWVRLEVPEWLWPELEASLRPEVEHELAALNEAAPLDLRVNLLKGDRAAALAALAAEGVEAAPTPLSPIGLRVSGRHNLAAGKAFRDGLVEIQDEASQLAALLVEARPGQAVLDLCAGGGGKTLALAAALGNKGRLLAADQDPARLERARPRLERAGVTCAELADLADIAESEERFDRVLVDAPCSGSGAWRRNPDARWRLTPETLDGYRQAQAEALRLGAGFVKPGGRLVYVTCSLLESENAAQVEGFLAERSDFRFFDWQPLWREVTGAEPPAEGAALTLTPARQGCDGFYVAILERVPA